MHRRIDSVSNDYLSPMRNSMVSSRKVSRESQRGARKYDTVVSRATSPPRIEVPPFRNRESTITPPNNPSPSSYLSMGMKTLPPLPLTPSTPDSSSFLDTSELFDAFPNVPQDLPTGPGTSLLSGFELGPSLDLGLGPGLGKTATVSSSYRSMFQSYR